MAHPTITYLISRIEDVQRYAGDIPPALVQGDLKELSDEIISYVPKHVDLAQLSMRLEAQALPDMQALRQATEILKETIPPTKFSFRTGHS